MSKPVKSPEPIRQVNRCASCWKRIGLTEFRCRCGDLFCGEHRYSDPHVCGYDYKGVRREANTRANPVVKAAMIVKISGENLVLAVSFSINFKLVFLRNISLIISLQKDVTSDGGDRPWESHHTVFTNTKADHGWLTADGLLQKIKSTSEICYPKRTSWKSNPARPCPNCNHIIDYQLEKHLPFGRIRLPPLGSLVLRDVKVEFQVGPGTLEG